MDQLHVYSRSINSVLKKRKKLWKLSHNLCIQLGDRKVYISASPNRWYHLCHLPVFRLSYVIDLAIERFHNWHNIESRCRGDPAHVEAGMLWFSHQGIAGELGPPFFLLCK